MALKLNGSQVEKISGKPTLPTNLDVDDIDFILEKLRKATYLGEEFEKFYVVWIKLLNLKKDK